MDSAQTPKGRITAQEYFEYSRRLKGGAGHFRQGDARGVKLMQLHIVVDQERRAAIKALGEAYQKSRREFYSLNDELQKKVDLIADSEMHAISQRVLDDAGQAVIMQAKYLQRLKVMHEAGLA